MYGLPKDFDATILVGRTLNMVCFAAYQVYLHFDSDTSITIESGFRHGARVSTRPPVVHSELMRLVERVIWEVEWNPDGTLKPRFQDGPSLTNYDDQTIRDGLGSSSFECLTSSLSA